MGGMTLLSSSSNLGASAEQRKKFSRPDTGPWSYPPANASRNQVAKSLTREREARLKGNFAEQTRVFFLDSAGGQGQSEVDIFRALRYIGIKIGVTV